MMEGIVRNEPRGPWHLEIHTHHRCNLGCFFCSNKVGGGDFDETACLPWDFLGPFIEARADEGLRMLRLSGGGEPLMYSGIRPLLELIRRRNLRLAEFNTNGTLLKDYARDLVQAGTDLVHLAINETEPALYARSMGTHERMFYRVLEGVEALREARDRDPGPVRTLLRFQLFLHRGNWDRLCQIYEQGVALGADLIHLNTAVGLPAHERIRPDCYPEIKRQLADVIRRDRTHGQPRLIIDMSAESNDLNTFAVEQIRQYPPRPGEFTDFTLHDPRRHYCFMPWYTANIAGTGSVHACCRTMDQSLGNIREQPWKAIWDGPHYRRLRGEIRRLMLLNGRMKYDPRRCRHLRPQCFGTYGCAWTFDLCSQDFYAELAERMSREVSPVERALAAGRDRLGRWTSRARSLARRLRP